MSFFSGVTRAVKAGLNAYQVNTAEEYFELQEQPGIGHSYSYNPHRPGLDIEKYEFLKKNDHIGAEYVLATNTGIANDKKDLLINNLIKKLKSSNTIEAQYYYALHLNISWKDRAENEKKVLKIMKKLADGGYSRASSWMGSNYDPLKQHDLAEKYLKQAIAQGNTNSIYSLALLNRSSKQALSKKLLIKAANANIYQAKYQVALEIAHGQLSEEQQLELDEKDVYWLIMDGVAVYLNDAVYAYVRLKKVTQYSEKDFNTESDRKVLKNILKNYDSWYIPKQEQEYDIDLLNDPAQIGGYYNNESGHYEI